VRPLDTPIDELAATRFPDRATVIAAMWVAVIYATIPFVRAVREWFVGRWSDQWITAGVIAVVAAVAVVGLVRHRARGSDVSRTGLLWAVVITMLLVWWAWRLRARPEEAVHLLEYGLLGVLLHRAVAPRIRDASAFVSAALLGSLVGIVDEIIQWVTPGRIWDLRDIAINSGACALVLVALWRIAPRRESPVVSDSIRTMLRLAATIAVIFALCLANTPTTVAWYSSKLPGFAFLRHADNAMVEYGHRHVFEGRGEFRSRLTLAELRKADASRSLEVAAVLDRYPRDRYGRFLREVYPEDDPFLYEARVHIFNRDRNMGEARRLPEGSDEFRRRLTVAHREEEILEAFFADTIGKSIHVLQPKLRRWLRQHHDADMAFSSKAGQHLITAISEPRLRLALLIAVSVMLAVDFWLGAREGRRRESLDP
jgi:hypothetical protein